MTFTKRFLNYKVLTVVFLFFSLIGSVYLVQLVQENRGQAKKGEKSDYDRRQERLNVAKLEKKVEEAQKVVNEKNQNGGSVAANNKLKEAQEALKKAKETMSSEIPSNGANDCVTNRKGTWCAGCGGGFCADGSQTCDTAIYNKCGETPQRGGKYIPKPIGGCSGDYYYECSCSSGNYCFDRGTYGSGDQCNNNGGLCDVVAATAAKPSGAVGTNTYYCPGVFIGASGGGKACSTLAPANFNKSCYCGTIQVDTVGGGFHSESMQCGCSGGGGEKESPTTPPRATNTPTKTLTNTPTLKPTITSTPTNTPTVTPTIASQTCGYTPCSTSQPCSSGLVCVTANNGNNYCSQPDFVSACIASPGYNSCCTIPTNTPTNTPTPTNTLTPTPTPTGVWLSPTPTPTRVYVTSGPSPTRIILPNSGVEFPIQILTIAGVITTLVGFLILL